jgi:hypothetical protein
METYRGSVDIRGLDGAIEFKSYRGRALVKMVNLTRNCRLETYRGEITLALPRDRGFQLDSDLGRHAGLSSDFRTPTENLSRNHKQYRGAVNGGGPISPQVRAGHIAPEAFLTVYNQFDGR